MVAKKVLVILAEGFEETEMVAPVDVLRRLQIDVTLAGLTSDLVHGSHKIAVKTDCKLQEVKIEDFDALFLPGGMPGSETLRDSSAVMDALKRMDAKGGIVSAICAAPIALARAGLLQGRNATCYPGFKLEGANYTGNRVERDGHVVTGKGAGAAFDFAFELAAALGKPRGDIKKLYDSMFVNL